MTTNSDETAQDPQTKVHDPDGDTATLRQILHAATGDRDAEAEALQERAGGDASFSDAREAVARVNHESADSATEADAELASPSDVAAVQSDCNTPQ